MRFLKGKKDVIRFLPLSNDGSISEINITITFVNIRMNGMKSRSDFISLKFSKVPFFYERLRFREWLRVGNKRFFDFSSKSIPNKIRFQTVRQRKTFYNQAFLEILKRKGRWLWF
jgi:hypothetical protein